MSKSAPHFMIVAGEASGDMHAAHLVREIRKLQPAATFSGLGGPKMAEAGVHLYSDLTRLAVVGFVEVVKHYGEIRKIFYSLLEQIRTARPDAVILVDYPGFNLRLAPRIKKMGIKVFYYISPQVWAWKENRVNIIREYTDRMFVLFPFEKAFYARHHMDVTFVGHPLIDQVKVTVSPAHFRLSHNIPPRHKVIGILPGSRENEISKLLPTMLEAAAIIKKDISLPVQFLLFRAPTIPLESLRHHLSGQNVPVTIIDDNIYDGIHACDLCLVTSGTATLETAILNIPMIIVYKTTLLTWLLAKIFVKIPHIGLVNVVAGEKVVPEYVQYDATAEMIALQATEILNEQSIKIKIKTSLSKVKGLLGSPGASHRTAQGIIEALT